MDDELVTAEEIAEAGPVVEGTTRLIVPKKGKLFNADGECKVAVIRPCISRGRRIRGLPPIYSPSMLAEHASVFTDWHMFMDHLTEEMVEALRERQRSIRELGGRMTKTWWDSDLRLKEDDENGYKQGGVVGMARPQPAIRAMLEADPEILHVSINAWPTSAKPGTLWGQQGMMIEGIRAKPRGSVDWVLRGGAGGRPLQEDQQLAVSLLESFYDAGPGDDVTDFDYANATVEQLQEHLEKQNPTLFGKLKEGFNKPPSQLPAPAASTPPATLTPEAVKEMLSEQQETLTKAFETKLTESTGAVEARAQELLTERETAKSYADTARQMIREAAGLTPGHRNELLTRYTVRPGADGVPAALQVSPVMEGEEVKKSGEAVLKEAVTADIEHALDMIAEAQGKPRVKGQGARGKVQEQEGETPQNAPRPNNAFREFMMESGGFEKVDDVDKVLESVGS